MIKKYYSRYTGKQIDEAVAALIENDVKIEDLNEEVVELINSKANEEDLAALKEEVNNDFKVALEDLVGNASEPTPIPTSGMIEKIYFNHNLTIDEVKDICDQLTFNIGSTCQYLIIKTETARVTIQGDYNANSPSQVSNYRMFVWKDAQYFEFDPYSGWQTGKNGDGSYEIEEEITSVGAQNDLLVNLISITPFGSKGRVGELEKKTTTLEIQTDNIVDHLERVDLAIHENDVAIEEINTNLDTKVGLVEVPQSLVVKLLGTLATKEYVDLTDEEMALFDNVKNKEYYVEVPDETQSKLIYRYKLIMNSGNVPLLIVESEVNALWINLTDKKAIVQDTLRQVGDSDLNYLIQENKDKITDVEEQLGNINSLLDQINGEVM